MTPTSNQIIKIGIAVLVLAGVSFVAYQIGYGNGAGTKSTSQPQNGQPVVAQTNMLFGTVDKISGQELVLKDVKRILDTTSGTSSQTVAVSIDSSTIIERLVPKDVATLKKEQDAFSKELQAQGAVGPTNSIVPPEPFIRTKIAFSDIKVGDSLVVSSNQDLSKLTAFTATQIDVQDNPIAPLSAGPTTSVVSATTSTKTSGGTMSPPPLPAGAKVQ